MAPYRCGQCTSKSRPTPYLHILQLLAVRLPVEKQVLNQLLDIGLLHLLPFGVAFGGERHLIVEVVLVVHTHCQAQLQQLQGVVPVAVEEVYFPEHPAEPRVTEWLACILLND